MGIASVNGCSASTDMASSISTPFIYTHAESVLQPSLMLDPAGPRSMAAR